MLKRAAPWATKAAAPLNIGTFLRNISAEIKRLGDALAVQTKLFSHFDALVLAAPRFK